LFRKRRVIFFIWKKALGASGEGHMGSKNSGKKVNKAGHICGGNETDKNRGPGTQTTKIRKKTKMKGGGYKD